MRLASENIRKGKVLFLFGYFTLIMSLLMFLIKNNSMLFQFRYLYILGAIMLMVISGEIYIKRLVALIGSFFLLHNTLFGIVLRKSNISVLTVDYTIQIFVFWGIVFLTSMLVYNYQVQNAFIVISQIAFSIIMNYSYIKHFNGLAPIKFLPNFFGVGDLERVRFQFGFVSTNSVAYLAMALFILTILVWSIEGDSNRIIHSRSILGKIYLLENIFLAIIVIISTGSRGALGGCCGFLIITYLLNKKYILGLPLRIIPTQVYLVIFIILFGFYGYFCLHSDARSDNFLVNMNAFREYGNTWLGMGYVPFSAFLTQAFGIKTYALDIYYVYIFFTTGIIGLFLIAAPLLLILYKYIKAYKIGRTTKWQNGIIALYLVSIFNGFTESNLIAPLSIGCYVNWILYILLLYDFKFKNKK